MTNIEDNISTNQIHKQTLYLWIWKYIFAHISFFSWNDFEVSKLMLWEQRPDWIDCCIPRGPTIHGTLGLTWCHLFGKGDKRSWLNLQNFSLKSLFSCPKIVKYHSYVLFWKKCRFSASQSWSNLPFLPFFHIFIKKKFW